MKKTIYMNDPLYKLAEKTKSKSRRTGGFSAALGDIVQKYDIIRALTPAPTFTEGEVEIMSEIISGMAMSASNIKYMHFLALDCATGSPESRKALSDRLSAMSAAEKVRAIESLLSGENA